MDRNGLCPRIFRDSTWAITLLAKSDSRPRWTESPGIAAALTARSGVALGRRFALGLGMGVGFTESGFDFRVERLDSGAGDCCGVK